MVGLPAEAAATIRAYQQDTAAEFDAMLAETGDPIRCLQLYPNTFRRSLEDGNRLCLCSFMSAEYAGLPEAVQREAQGFADVNVAWLTKVLVMAGMVESEDCEARARAVFAAVSGAQLYARSRSDISQFDRLIDSYRATGLLPAWNGKRVRQSGRTHLAFVSTCRAPPVLRRARAGREGARPRVRTRPGSVR